MKSNWVGDRKVFFDWIQSEIIKCPNEKQFSILEELVDFLPTDEFLLFMSKPEDLPKNVLIAEINFLDVALKSNKNFMFQVPFQFFIKVSIDDDFEQSVYIEKLFSYFKQIVMCDERKFSESEIKEIENVALHFFFEIETKSFDKFNLIKFIANNLSGVNEMAQLILVRINDNESENMNEFIMEKLIEDKDINENDIQKIKKNR